MLNATGPDDRPPAAAADVIGEAEVDDAHRPATRRRSLTVAAHPVVALVVAASAPGTKQHRPAVTQERRSPRRACSRERDQARRSSARYQRQGRSSGEAARAAASALVARAPVPAYGCRSRPTNMTVGGMMPPRRPRRQCLPLGRAAERATRRPDVAACGERASSMRRPLAARSSAPRAACDVDLREAVGEAAGVVGRSAPGLAHGDLRLAGVVGVRRAKRRSSIAPRVGADRHRAPRRAMAAVRSGWAGGSLRRAHGRAEPHDPHTRTASYLAEPGEVHRVLLLYSGGLDTSVMLKWIQDEYEAEVVALTVNLGQPGEDYDVVQGKALQLGARRGRGRRRARGVRARLRRPGDQGQRDLRPRPTRCSPRSGGR